MTRKMKDSGIEWIGEIPEDWEGVKLKYTSDSHIPHSFEDGDWIESKYISEDGIRYLTTGNIGDGEYKEQGSGYVSEENFKILNCKYAYPDDLIFSRLNAPYGRSCLLPNIYNKYVVAVDNVILRPSDNYDKKFINYLTQCTGYQKSVEDAASGATMQRISRTKLGNIQLPFPNIETQKKISYILDKKTNQIDGIRNTINKEIENLENYKKSVITETVTKGLDKNVEMKDSGIGWIGKIPKHWEIKNIKNLTLKSERGTSPSYIEDDTKSKVVNQATFSQGFFDKSNIKYSKIPTNNSRGLLKKGDVLIASTGGGVLGKTHFFIEDGEYVADGHITILRTDSLEQNSKILYYIFSVNYELINGILAKGSTNQTELQSEWLKNFKVPYTSINEQNQIVDYLDKKTKLIDDSIAIKQKQLETLEEYKKSLIYEYVTGKKEVNDGEES